MDKDYYFNLEREKRKDFDRLYKELGTVCKRVYGSKNREYDCLIKKNTGWIKVEEKFLQEEWEGLLVEMMQDTETNAPGWIIETKSDLIFYWMHKKVFCIKTRPLKRFVLDYGDRFHTIISTKGWGRTKNILIPWEYIFANNLGKLIYIDKQNSQ